MRAADDAYYIRMDLNVPASRLLDRVLADLEACGNVDYAGHRRERFDRLVLLLLRFLQTRMDALGARYPYLRRIERDAPLEWEPQEDLASFLSAHGEAEPERTGVSSGRADIYLPQPSRTPFRFVIEVKRLESPWTDAAIKPFLRQTTAYHQTDLRLGALVVLDLSDRPAGVPHLEACVHVAERAVNEQDLRHAVVVRLPGNRRTPSDHGPP